MDVPTLDMEEISASDETRRDEEDLEMDDTIPKDEETLHSPQNGPASSSIRSRKSTRLKRRFTSLPFVSRTIRSIRFILGPSTPFPDDQLPQPEPSFTLGLTMPHRSWLLPIDQRLTDLTSRWKLHRGLYIFLVLWATANVLLIRQQYYVSDPQIISCDATLWNDWPPDVCGFNGSACTGQLTPGTYKCMGGCRDAILGNPRWIGGEEIDLKPLIIGGGNNSVYRADSWICPSAIHSGLINPNLGGCVSVFPIPQVFGFSNFVGSFAHDLHSVGFQPHFPGAYSLTAHHESGCFDLHPIISSFNAICLLITVLFLRPSTAVLMAIITVLGYFQIMLVSDPEDQPPYWEDVFGGLPAVLITAYWAYRVSFRRTLRAFVELPMDVAIWQGLGYWIGIESSTIFAKLPIQRLGYGGLSASGVVTLILIIILVIIVVAIQGWQGRKYGMLQYYLFWYLPLVPILIVLAFIPGYTLRLHHYLYSLIAIPVLSLPNRVSLFGQAFTYALFIDGVGRWGWASIVQQTTTLVGDANAGTQVPILFPNSTANTISWESISPALVADGFEGVAIMVDDILRDATNLTTYNLSTFNLDPTIDHYLRLAYVANETTLDYIDPLIMLTNGSLFVL